VIPPPQLAFGAVMPLLLTAIAVFAVLLLELFLRGRATLLGRRVTDEFIGSVLTLVSASFLVLVIAVACSNFVAGTAPEFNPAHPMLRLDRFANFSTALIALATLLTALLSTDYLREMRINRGEYYALLLISAFGMMLLVAAVDLMTIFLAIEIMSIPLYVLAGFDRRRLRSNESALKYFVIGSFASALLLYGMALLYGATGATELGAVGAALEQGDRIAMLGLGLVLVGFAFKIGAVPFHQWTPDVYEGAPTPVTAFMSVAVKFAAFAGLLRLTAVAFEGAAANLEPILQWLAGLTMLLGSLMAMSQDNLKRLLAYSSIAHAGFVLLGFVAGTSEALAAVLFYLVVYAFTNLGAFAVLIALTSRGQDAERVDDLSGLYQRRPVLAGLMALFMFSLAGIPGTGGFLAKLDLFMAAVGAGQVPLVLVAILATFVSVYVYLRISIAMFMRSGVTDAPPDRRLHTAEAAVLLACAAAVVVLGVFPNDGPGLVSWVATLDWSRDAIAALEGPR
jgi:NADH-quinone oxidoreductase subunit N